ncbi:MAG: PspA/IM30 family protein [Chloroflexota bacterium]|nr:PspA/IM30 family protein [Chloroflexota bacterium]
MNLLERVLTLLRINVNSMIEKADDPEKVLKQLQLDMRNQLMQVKTQVATAIATSHELKKQRKEKEAEADMWYKKAEQAIQQNNDNVARRALAQYNDILKQAQRYQQQQKEQEQLVLTMRDALRQLESKIAEVETTIDLLLTQKRNALLQQRVYDSLSKTGDPKMKERTAKAQDAVVEAEARARALAELHKRTLEGQLDQLSTEQIIERQMQDLKNKKHPQHRVPLLHEGNPRPSPLLPPQPRGDGHVKQQVETKRGHEPSSASPSVEQDAVKEKVQKLLENS